MIRNCQLLGGLLLPGLVLSVGCGQVDQLLVGPSQQGEQFFVEEVAAQEEALQKVLEACTGLGLQEQQVEDLLWAARFEMRTVGVDQEGVTTTVLSGCLNQCDCEDCTSCSVTVLTEAEKLEALDAQHNTGAGGGVFDPD